MDTDNSPFVIVPVLSNAMFFILLAFSSTSLFFTSIPFLLHIPLDITIARGVASPRLHGHAITRTETNIFIAVFISATTSHTKNEITARIITTGTKYPLILSATLAIGALVFVASTTIFTISDTVDSFPIF